MQQTVDASFEDVDAVLLVIDARARIGAEGIGSSPYIYHSREASCVIALDESRPTQGRAGIASQNRHPSGLGDFHASAITKEVWPTLKRYSVLLPEGPLGREQRPDLSTRRHASAKDEKALRLTREEVPHTVMSRGGGTGGNDHGTRLHQKRVSKRDTLGKRMRWWLRSGRRHRPEVEALVGHPGVPRARRQRKTEMAPRPAPCSNGSASSGELEFGDRLVVAFVRPAYSVGHPVSDFGTLTVPTSYSAQHQVGRATHSIDGKGTCTQSAGSSFGGAEAPAHRLVGRGRARGARRDLGSGRSSASRRYRRSARSFRMMDLTEALEGRGTAGKVAALCAKAMRRIRSTRRSRSPRSASIQTWSDREGTCGRQWRQARVRRDCVSIGSIPGSKKKGRGDASPGRELGADEVDMVIDRGAFPIGSLRESVRRDRPGEGGVGDAHLKVISETG